MTNTKPRIDSASFVLASEFGDKIGERIHGFIQDLAIDIASSNRPELNIDNEGHSEILLDLELDIEEILAGIILQKIKSHL